MAAPTDRDTQVRAESPVGGPSMTEIRMLGGFEVSVDGQPIQPEAWRRRKAADLLKLLGLAEGHRLHRDQVVDALWPDADPDSGANNLYQAIHAARRTLADAGGSRDLMTLRDGVLALERTRISSDVDAFEAAVARLDSGERDALDAALALYRGDLLPDDRYEEWTTLRRDALAGTYLRILREVARRHESRGESDAASKRLHELIQRDPLDEDAHRRLMRLEAVAGRTNVAIALFEDLQTGLKRDLGVGPSDETMALRQAILHGRVRPTVPPTDLPNPLTSFIGRTAELAAAARLLGSTRLLTLTGSGGTGKTRLALQVASAQMGEFRDGIFFVALESVSEPDLIASAIVEAIGVEPGVEAPEIRLIGHLRDRQLLLVLDNFEQILAGAPFVSRLLSAAHGLKIIVTSRISLRITGEQELEVPPFGLPDTATDRTTDRIASSDAVRLFVERAKAVNPGLALSDDNAAAVAEIAVQLDGLPLAIELAAARVRLLPIEALRARLGDRLGELTDAPRDWPARHQTLGAAIDWSYKLLDEPDRRLFERIAVFTGGGSLTELETVCGPASDLGRDVLSGLRSLVEQSLLRPIRDTPFDPRFAMLPTIREYGLMRLDTSGDAPAFRERHADAFVALAEHVSPELTGQRARTTLDRLALDHDNIRAVLVWATEEDKAEPALRMIAAIWRFWQMRGHLFEADQRLRSVLALSSASKASAVLRARALGAAGSIAYWRGDPDGTSRYYAAALDAAREATDRATLAGALYNMAFSLRPGESEDASALDVDVDYVTQSLDLYRELADMQGIANATWALGVSALRKRDFDEARGYFRDGVTAYEAVGDQIGSAWALHQLGVVATLSGDLDEAEATFSESLDRMWRAGNVPGVALVVMGFAVAARHRGQSSRYWRLAGAADSLRLRTGANLVSAGGIELEHLPARPIDDIEAAGLWDAGAAMSIDDAIAFARDLKAR
jgi:predicted ATPase/DNA-binding SARP family transcriptional activator